MAINERMQARCAHATLLAFAQIGVDPSEHTSLFLRVAQLLHVAATGASADMDRPCALAIAAEDITGGRARKWTRPSVSVKHQSGGSTPGQQTTVMDYEPARGYGDAFRND